MESMRSTEDNVVVSPSGATDVADVVKSPKGVLLQSLTTLSATADDGNLSRQTLGPVKV
jgi:hypothetical protein